MRPGVEVSHCLAQLCGHAAARLKKLPDRAAEAHEALREVDPQHVQTAESEAVHGWRSRAHALYMVSFPLRQLQCKHKTEGVEAARLAHPTVVHSAPRAGSRQGELVNLRSS